MLFSSTAGSWVLKLNSDFEGFLGVCEVILYEDCFVISLFRIDYPCDREN